MQQYLSHLEVRFRHADTTGPWQPYDQVVDPSNSQVPFRECWDDASWPRTEERARLELDEALDTVANEQYLACVARGETIEVRVRIPTEADPADTDLAVCVPTPRSEALAYLSAAVRGYDAVRADLRCRVRAAHRAGIAVDDLVSAAVGRIDAKEVHALVEAERIADAVRDVVKNWPDPDGRARVIVDCDASVHVLLHASRVHKISYEAMWDYDGQALYDEDEVRGYDDGVRDAEKLLAMLIPHYTVTSCAGSPATAHDLAPRHPPEPGRVRVAGPPGLVPADG